MVLEVDGTLYLLKLTLSLLKVLMVKVMDDAAESRKWTVGEEGGQRLETDWQLLSPAQFTTDIRLLFPANIRIC